MKSLGPAVHPSECALRPIAPVTKGPIPIGGLKTVLDEMVKLHSNLMENKLRNEFLSFESGRSRFQISAADDLPGPSELFGESYPEHTFGISESSHRYERESISFSETMRALYTQSSAQTDLCRIHKYSHLSCDANKEHSKHQPEVWSRQVKNPLLSKSLYLRHAPADLTQIQRFKSFHSADITAYANVVASFFQPRLRTLHLESGSSRMKMKNGLGLFGVSNGEAAPTLDKLSLRFKFAPASCSNLESETDDFPSRGLSVSFAQFFENFHYERGDDEKVSSPSWASCTLNHLTPSQPALFLQQIQDQQRY